MTPKKQDLGNKLEAGRIIAERFRIKRCIGGGGQGTVYLVEDTINNNCEKALKTLRKEVLPQNLQRMKTEVTALQIVNSKYVLQLESTNLDIYEEDSDHPPYFVTELAKYGTLTEHNYYNGEIDICLRLFRDICEGVMAIHKAGIIHRDLKPSNILLIQNEKDIRIGDFGICYIDLEKDTVRATKIREQVGPRYFAAPEQTSLPPNFSNKSDIYSLGRILYFLVTGVYEFVPGDEYIPVTIHLSLKEQHPIDIFIQKLIKFDPGDRPNSIEDIIFEIDKLLKVEDKEFNLELSEMQRRIMKYVESYSPRSVELGSIFNYLANFYGIEKKAYNNSIFDYSPVRAPSWSGFTDTVENSLIQLEKAGLLVFERGEYRYIR